MGMKKNRNLAVRTDAVVEKNYWPSNIGLDLEITVAQFLQKLLENHNLPFST